MGLLEKAAKGRNLAVDALQADKKTNSLLASLEKKKSPGQARA